RAGQPLHLDKAKAMKGEPRLPRLLLIGPLDVTVLGTSSAQWLGVELAGFRQHLRMAQGNRSSRRADGLQPDNARHVLAQVKDINPWTGLGDRNRVNFPGRSHRVAGIALDDT